jgi:hypothetical protein
MGSPFGKPGRRAGLEGWSATALLLLIVSGRRPFEARRYRAEHLRVTGLSLKFVAQLFSDAVRLTRPNSID